VREARGDALHDVCHIKTVGLAINAALVGPVEVAAFRHTLAAPDKLGSNVRDLLEGGGAVFGRAGATAGLGIGVAPASLGVEVEGPAARVVVAPESARVEAVAGRPVVLADALGIIFARSSGADEGVTVGHCDKIVPHLFNNENGWLLNPPLPEGGGAVFGLAGVIAGVVVGVAPASLGEEVKGPAARVTVAPKCARVGAVAARPVAPGDALVVLFARSRGADEAVTVGHCDGTIPHLDNTNGRRCWALVRRTVHRRGATIVDGMSILAPWTKVVIYPDANPVFSAAIAAPPIFTTQGVRWASNAAAAVVGWFGFETSALADVVVVVGWGD